MTYSLISRIFSILHAKHIATSMPTRKQAENASFSAPRCSDSDHPFRNWFPTETQSSGQNSETLRLCGKQNAYLTGSLQKSRRPQSAQKSRPLLRLSQRESSSRGALRLLRSSRAPSCDFASQSSLCYSSGDLTTSLQVHFALTRPDRSAAGASRSSVNLIAFGDRRMSRSTISPSPAAQSRRRRRCRCRGWRGRRS